MDGICRVAPGRRIVLLAWAAAGLAIAACTTTPSRSPEQVLRDATVTSRIKTSLLRDPVVAGSAIGVEVQDGVVTLTGRVPSETVAARAVDIARNTEDVRRVEDRLIREGPGPGSGARLPEQPGASGEEAPTRRPAP